MFLESFHQYISNKKHCQMLERLFLLFHETINLLCAVLLSAEVQTDGPKIAVIIQQYVVIDFLLLQTFIIKMLILAQKNQCLQGNLKFF